MRKIEVPTDTPTEFKLGDTAADIQDGGGRRENRERWGREREEARRKETTHLREDGVAKNSISNWNFLALNVPY